MLLSVTAPGLKTVSVHVVSSPLMKRIRAGMLVMKVPMKNHPKIRPSLRVSTPRLRSLATPPQRTDR